MRRFQKVLFSLAAVVLLGWMGASTASAQVAFLASASGARPLRFEGLTEATGVIVLSTTSAGTVGGAALPAGGSEIIFDYGTLVTSTGDSAPPDAALLACSGTVGLFFNAGGAPAVGTVIAKSCSGNSVILTFIGAGVTFPAGGGSITLSGVRVNANFRGAGASISVNISAIPAAGTTVTISTLGSLVVGTVQAAPSTTTVSLVAAGSGFGGSIQNIALCTVSTLPLSTVNVTVGENFPQAFLSAAQEDALGATGTGGANTVFKIRFRFLNLPVGIRVTPAVVAANTSATLTGIVTPALFTATVEDAENDFDFTIGGTSLTAVEQLGVSFTFSIPNLANFDATKETTTELRVFLRGSADPPASPVFSTSGAAIQLKKDVLRTIVCASYLLFPWVAYTSDGTLDTGIVISNTTADPAVLNSTKQKGDVTLYFWTADGSTAPAPLKIATALDAGKSATFVASSLGKGYSGYVVAVCGFQMGHGLAAFLAPKAGNVFAPYIALSLFNPRLPGGGTEFVTQ